VCNHDCSMFARIRLLAALFAFSTVACATVAGCAVDSAEDAEDGVAEGDGDGTTGEDEIVSERQLMGNELPEKSIALTYDDGPGARTGELADYLAEQGIPAAFFINGSKVPGKQLMIDKIIGRGHLLANHTHNHLQLTKLSSEKVVKEVSDTDAVLASAQPNGPWVLRAPFGAWNGNTARALNATSMKKYVGSVFWDMGGALTATAAADWDCWGKGLTVQRCGDLYLQEIKAKKRGIVLFHDIHGKSVDMTKYIVPKLKAEGFKFVKLQDVPSVKRAIGALAAPSAPEQCMSSTLGKNVDEDVCVQSRRDQKWYRCVDGEWNASAGATDAKCSQRIAL
jgi:peptidoglycan/xylan/chitin deacetylase (PgdA/CDA1 family)